MLFVSTAGTPWYDLLLVALAALTGAWQWLTIVAADYVGYLTSALGDRTLHLLLETYSAALVAALVITVARRRLQSQPSRKLRPVWST